jgi:Cupin-like domain
MTGPRPMTELDGLDRATFDREVRPHARPVIIRGLAADWPAVQAGREGDANFIAYLKQFVTTRPVTAVVGQAEIEGRFFYNDDLTSLNFERGTSPLAPFLDRLLRDASHPRPLAMAVQSEPVADLLPGFEQVNKTDLVPPLTVPRAWLGNRIRVGAHSDLMENIGIVVAGHRRFTLFAPDQVANLYPGPFELTPAGTPVSMVDLAAPDLERFPAFADALANAEVAELEPGDAIYIPYHWWHAVESLDAVNLFVNYWWNDAGRQAASPYEAMMHAFLAIKTLPADQREVWQMLFDHYVFGANGDPAAHLPPHAKGMLGELDERMKDQLRTTLAQVLSR